MNINRITHKQILTNRPVREFAREFERKATDAGVKDEDAKATLITLLNVSTMQRLDQYIILQGEVDSTDLTAEQHLGKVPYKQILTYLK